VKAKKSEGGASRQLGDMRQQTLGFASPGVQQPLGQSAKASGCAKEHFDRPHGRHLRLPGSGQRLDTYLKERGQQWVLRLRELLEQMDWSLLESRYSGRGRRPIHPSIVVGLILYGMFKARWSLRQLEELATVDLGAWWVCGGRQPDYSTISKFILLHQDTLSEAFFEATVKGLVNKLQLGAGTVAGDGTVIAAAASRFGTMKAEALLEAAQAARQAAAQTAAGPQAARLVQQADRMEQAAQVAQQREQARQAHGRDPEAVRVSPVDPEAVVQRDKDEVVRPSFKPSILAHQSGLIVGQTVLGTSETAAVEPELLQHQRIFGQAPQAALLDAGYHSIGVFRVCQAHGIPVYCPPGKTFGETVEENTEYKGKFSKALFVYQPEADQYICPAGQVLVRLGAGRDREGREFGQYRGPGCAGCPSRPKCTDSPKGRTVKRYEGEELREAAVERLKTPEGRALYKLRSVLAERPLAELKERQGLRRFHRHGQRGARVEFALHCIAFNFRRVLRGRLCVLGLFFRLDKGPWQRLWFALRLF
jgi:transposase